MTGSVDCRKYAALSYCWGQISEKQKSFVTKKRNIALRLSGFQMHELPRTLQDGIRTARALNIDFLWIDSICIIQDDPEDWSREASRMGSIYNHAYLTIAAANSKSSFDGFLEDRNPVYRTNLGFTFSELEPNQIQFPAREAGIIGFRCPPQIGVKKSLLNCDWDQRGWTLQENLMSTRVLYFTQETIYYECIESQKMENPGYELPIPRDAPKLIAESRVLPSAKRMRNREDYLSVWYKIVQAFSDRKLTCPEDKLPAMEGLARIWGELIDDVYIYGL